MRNTITLSAADLEYFIFNLRGLRDESQAFENRYYKLVKNQRDLIAVDLTEVDFTATELIEDFEQINNYLKSAKRRFDRVVSGMTNSEKLTHSDTSHFQKRMGEMIANSVKGV